MKLIYLISLVLVRTSMALGVSHLAPDFVIGAPPAVQFANKVRLSSALSLAKTDSCEELIAKKICRVSNMDSKECLPASPEGLENLRAVYRLLQAPLQKMMCAIPTILFVDDLEAVAMAGAYGQPLKAFLAISTSFIERNYDPNTVFSWKEQGYFKNKAPRFEVSNEGPHVWSRSLSSMTTAQYVITHELGHVFDAFNKANRFKCAPDADCSGHPNTTEELKKFLTNQLPVTDSWAALSWKNGTTPNDENNFPLQEKICFYGCKERLKLSDVSEFYRQLDGTTFITPYAASNPFEDFAESMAFYFMANADYNFQYRIDTNNAIYFQEWKWSQSKKKYNWIELFFEGDLKYPQ